MPCLVGLKWCAKSCQPNSHEKYLHQKKKKGLAHMGVVNYSQVADGSTYQHQLANV